MHRKKSNYVIFTNFSYILTHISSKNSAFGLGHLLSKHPCFSRNHIMDLTTHLKETKNDIRKDKVTLY